MNFTRQNNRFKKLNYHLDLKNRYQINSLLGTIHKTGTGIMKIAILSFELGKFATYKVKHTDGNGYYRM